MKHELISLLTKKWKKKNHVNVYLIDDLHKAGGIAMPPYTGRGIVIDHRSGANGPDNAGVVLAQEIGHYLGILRHSKDSQNIMSGSGLSHTMLNNPIDQLLPVKQVEDVHATLSKSLSRKHLRIE
jgi:hypothetical protein